MGGKSNTQQRVPWRGSGILIGLALYEFSQRRAGQKQIEESQ
jgi:hypothetical protein